MDGVHRPAMTAVWPTLRGRTVVLDVGANVEADAQQLVTFAIMGEAFARATLGIARPSVGLLNIGSEEMKGHEEVREAHEWLRAAGLDLDYRGFVEGDDISAGAVDVVVTDGFTGNVALKTGEGVARMLASHMREAFTSSLPAKAGAVLAMSGLKRLKSLMDPSNVNGGVLLGRAWAYALAAEGEAGVAHVLQLISAEMMVAMALTGVTKISQLSPDNLVRSAGR